MGEVAFLAPSPHGDIFLPSLTSISLKLFVWSYIDTKNICVGMVFGY